MHVLFWRTILINLYNMQLIAWHRHPSHNPNLAATSPQYCRSHFIAGEGIY